MCLNLLSEMESFATVNITVNVFLATVSILASCRLILVNFFPPTIDVLADNGRLSLTSDVITAFGKMMSAHRGEVTCTVTTAQVRFPDFLLF